MRVQRLTAFVAVASLAFAACGSDSANDASETTLAQPSNTTIASRATTTRALGSGVSPCLTKDEVTALVGRAPDTIEDRPNAGTGWPDGSCRVRFIDVAEWDISFDLLSSESIAEERYDDSVERARSNKYHEELRCSGIGDECYLSRGTGNDSVVGLIGLLYARDGSRWIGSSYSDAQLKLRPTIEESAKLLQELVRAYLVKVKAA